MPIVCCIIKGPCEFEVGIFDSNKTEASTYLRPNDTSIHTIINELITAHGKNLKMITVLLPTPRIWVSTILP